MEKLPPLVIVPTLYLVDGVNLEWIRIVSWNADRIKPIPPIKCKNMSFSSQMSGRDNSQHHSDESNLDPRDDSPKYVQPLKRDVIRL